MSSRSTRFSDGRAARPEYWWFFLINILISIAIAVVVGAAAGRGTGQFVADLYSLAVFLPSLGVGIRRLHDTNRSGWWILIGLIPVLGWIWLIVLLVLPGDPGPNRYGNDPYGRGAAAYDPQTGAPLGGSASEPPRFDPQTGQPLTPPPPPTDPPAPPSAY